MATLEWKFKEYLDAHGITPYRLQKEMGGQVSHRLSYDWARERPERLHLPVLERVMSALEGMTGEPVDIKDFLEFVPDPEPEMDEETRAWLDAPIDAPLEPYDWGDQNPETLGEALRFDAERGWVKGG